MMLRSIIAVTIGVLAAVAFIIYVSFFVVTAVSADGTPVQDMKALPLANQFGVIAVWFAGTLLGAIIASLGSRRWAPSAWVVAATMALFAVTNFSNIPAPIWLPMLSMGLIGAGGWGAIKLTKATCARPSNGKGRLGL